MAAWHISLYTLNGTGDVSGGYLIDDVLLSGKLVKTLDETTKLTFSVSMNALLGFFSNVLPLKAYATVYRDSTLFFTGLVERRTMSLADMVYTFECCGGLGALKYMAPYRKFPAGTDADVVLDVLSQRFRGTASAPYSTYNPSSIFQNIYDLRNFGSTAWAFFGVQFNNSLDSIQKSAATTYDFYKALLDTNNLVWFENFGLPHLFESADGSIYWGEIVDTHPNTQEIRYGRNLVSCEITDNVYPTVATAYGSNSSQDRQTAEYPFPFDYEDVVLPDKSGGTYSASELRAAADNLLNEPQQIISAVGFDEGILDNGTPFLDMKDPVYLVYLENNVEKRILAHITSITYDLTNPSKDRVQLGKKIIPLTQRS